MRLLKFNVFVFIRKLIVIFAGKCMINLLNWWATRQSIDSFKAAENTFYILSSHMLLFSQMTEDANINYTTFIELWASLSSHSQC